MWVFGACTYNVLRIACRESWPPNVKPCHFLRVLGLLKDANENMSMIHFLGDSPEPSSTLCTLRVGEMLTFLHIETRSPL
jgi:hypothetical protein